MQLARAEGSRLRTGEPTDMVPVLKIVAGDFDRIGEGDRLRLSISAAPVPSDLDPDAFGILARNLIENALRHGAPDKPIDVRLTEDGVLTVENDGALIPERQIASFGQRFHRGEDAGEGSGLGLAIARTIADRTGAQLSFVSPAPGRKGGLSVRFVLPDPEEPTT